MKWYPDLYDRFELERLMPMDAIFPLLEIRHNMEIIDLGCGSGVLTDRLSRLFPKCFILGIDSSPDMLKKATAKSRNNLKFKNECILNAKGQWDLVFSHSAIQWVGEHRKLIPKLCSLVKPGGQLVVQLPSIHQNPFHVLMREIALESPFKEALRGWVRESTVLSLEEYAQLMHQHLGDNVNVFSKIYSHEMQNVYQLVDWLLGTSLSPYLQRMPSDLCDLFIRRYKKSLINRCGVHEISYFLHRIFLIGKMMPM